VGNNPALAEGIIPLSELAIKFPKLALGFIPVIKSRQFTEKQDEWLQNSYNLPKNEKRFVTLNVTNP
jgi:hypothetical protein